MKKNILCLCACLLLTACGRTAPPLIGSEAAHDSAPLQTSAPDASEPEAPATLAADWSNWVDGSLPYSYGCRMNLLVPEQSTDGLTPMVGAAANLSGDPVSVWVNYTIELDGYSVPGDARMTCLVSVNGQLCDFTLDGRQSDGGILTKQTAINTEHLENLVIEDCTIQAENNTLTFYLIAYFPQRGRMTASPITRTFTSETVKTQSSAITYPDSADGLKIINAADITQDEREALLKESSNFRIQQLRFEEMKNCSHVAADSPTAYRYISRDNTTDEPAANSTLLCAVLRNGEPIPAFGGNPLLQIPVTADLICAEIPFQAGLQAGEYSHITFLIFDEANNVDHYSEKLYYAED